MMQSPPRSLFILTGETSGDHLAAKLIPEIQKKYPDIRIHGVCGPQLRALGVTNHIDMENFQTLFPMTILAFPKLYWNFSRVLKTVLQLNPDICLCVDASFMSLHLGQRLRQAGYRGRLIKYVCPALWWPDKGRRDKLISYFNDLICIFPGEAEHFQNTSLKVHYFGNPYFHQNPYTPIETKTLTLFPGSRPIELMFGFSKMLKACLAFQSKYPTFQLNIACISPKWKTWMQKRIHTKVNLVNAWEPESKRQLLSQTCLAIAKPGSNNLELVQYRIPTLVTYPISTFISRLVLWWMKEKREFHSMVNWLFGKEVFPELLLTKSFSIAKSVSHLENLLKPDVRKFITDNCDTMSQKLSCDSHSKTLVDALF